MFPLQQNDELFFQISSYPSQQHKIPQDQILSSHDQHHRQEKRISNTINNNISDNFLGKKGTSVRSLCVMESKDNKKKMIHRDVERQRRQEMATLYSSLRSLLPLEFIKGKRSTSDQMEEAVKYIEHLQRNIKDLSFKRDELRILYGATKSSNNTNNDISYHVVVHKSLVGVEIVFSSSFVHSHDNPQLSSVLQVLLEEGLCVLTCVSTKVAATMIHTVQCEVSDVASNINIKELQDKLSQLKL